jgi:type IV pilus assembly protein PilA
MSQRDRRVTQKVLWMGMDSSDGGVGPGPKPHEDRGFTLVELMVVVLILGVLVVIAIPIFFSLKASAEQKTCFANERTLEDMANLWLQDTPEASLADLAGPVIASHPLITYFIIRPPRCPVAPAPADSDNPAVGEGIYTLNASGTVLPCVFGNAGPHGRFQ